MSSADELLARVLALRDALQAHPELYGHLSTVDEVLVLLAPTGSGVEATEAPPTDFLYPDWTAAGRIHEWKNYVGAPMRASWASLPLHIRALLATQAQEQADAEEWD